MIISTLLYANHPMYLINLQRQTDPAHRRCNMYSKKKVYPEKEVCLAGFIPQRSDLQVWEKCQKSRKV